jgi:hypothetical protein
MASKARKPATSRAEPARQREAAWGVKVIDRLWADLKEAFPDMDGLLPRKLLAMKVFAREFPVGSIAQQAVAQMPWSIQKSCAQKLFSNVAGLNLQFADFAKLKEAISGKQKATFHGN